MAAINFVKWIAEKVADAAEKEFYDPEIIRSELMILSEKLDSGEISVEDYDIQESDLLDRLEISQERMAE